MEQKLNDRLDSIAKHVRNQQSNKVGLRNTLDNHRVKGLYKLICTEELLTDSYLRIRSKQSANTTVKGSMLNQYGKEKNPETDLIRFADVEDGISVERIQAIKESLKNESFQFKPTTEVLIPKPGKKTKRPLGLPEPTDKIVQRAMTTVLTVVFEEGKIFSDFSHAYRPKRGAHSCLEMVERSFQSSKYIIEADIKGCSPLICHTRLIKILEKYIDDKRFISLTYKALKAGIVKLVDPDKPHGSWAFTPSGRTGTPQGSIVSPILSNIYLHELDYWMSNICKPREKHPRNPEIAKLNRLNDKDRKVKEANPERHKELSNVIRKRLVECKKLPSTIKPDKPTYRYVRYADDLIIGVEGSYAHAGMMKTKLANFLSEHLAIELDLEKTSLTNLYTNNVEFLGYNIYHSKHNTYHNYFVRKSDGSRRKSKRRGRNNLHFQINRARVLNRLKNKGMIKNLGSQKYRAISVKGKVFLEDRQIVSYFDSVNRDFLNYYSGAFNRGDLAQIQHFIKRSCAMTLAHKHRTSSRKILKKHGPNLSIKWETSKGVLKDTRLNLMETTKTTDRC